MSSLSHKKASSISIVSTPANRKFQQSDSEFTFRELEEDSVPEEDTLEENISNTNMNNEREFLFTKPEKFSYTGKRHKKHLIELGDAYDSEPTTEKTPSKRQATWFPVGKNDTGFQTKVTGSWDMSKFKKPGDWICPICNTQWNVDAVHCGACDTPKPADASDKQVSKHEKGTSGTTTTSAPVVKKAATSGSITSYGFTFGGKKETATSSSSSNISPMKDNEKSNIEYIILDRSTLDKDLTSGVYVWEDISQYLKTIQESMNKHNDNEPYSVLRFFSRSNRDLDPGIKFKKVLEYFLNNDFKIVPDSNITTVDNKNVFLFSRVKPREESNELIVGEKRKRT